MKPLPLTNAALPQGRPQPIGTRIPNAVLTSAAGAVAQRSPSRRNRVWEISPMMHCSIIGTCLTNGELRSVLRRSGALPGGKATDHELHQIAVSAAGRHDDTSRQIQKALDERHRAVVSRFGAAAGVDALSRLWNEAVQGGDIPGAYWALLTHPLCDDELAQRAFGDVHMFSHLLGSASLVALQKLRRLESERAELEDKLQRQQERLREALLTGDARVRELNAALGAQAERAAGAAAQGAVQPELAALNQLVADLRKQFDGEARRRERAEKKLQDASAAAAARTQECQALAADAATLQAELAAAETALAAFSGDAAEQGPVAQDLAGAVVLYVGGRPRQAAQMRLVVERAGGEFLHHDGGIEERGDLLPGLVSRAQVALFPVDCISHDAALSLKRLCRQAGKPFVPLRSSGVSAFLHALAMLDINAPAISA